MHEYTPSPAYFSVDVEMGTFKKKIKDEIIHIALTWTQRWLLFNFKLPKFEIRQNVLICLKNLKCEQSNLESNQTKFSSNFKWFNLI